MPVAFPRKSRACRVKKRVKESNKKKKEGKGGGEKAVPRFYEPNSLIMGKGNEDTRIPSRDK